MPDYESMSIEQLEAEVNRIEGEIKGLRVTQLKVHDMAEAKRRMIPILATPLDQTITPGQGVDILKWLGSIPQAARDLIKKSLEGDK
jgi:hypothetical protein